MDFEEKDIYLSPSVISKLKKHEESLKKDPPKIVPYKDIVQSKSKILDKYGEEIDMFFKSFVKSYEKQEKERSSQNRQLFHDLQEALKTEKNLTQKNKASIDLRWKNIQRSTSLEKVRELIADQRERISTVLERKKAQVSKLKSMIHSKDLELQNQITTQDEELTLYNEKVYNEISGLKMKCRKVLNGIEETFEKERKKILDYQMEQHEELIDHKQQLEKLLKREGMTTVENNEKKITYAHDEFRDNILQSKNKLEDTFHKLQRQMAQFHGLYHLNSSKMKYYIDILEHELIENNAIARGNKITLQRLQDQLVKVTGKYRIDVQKAKEENNNLSKSYTRNTQQFKMLLKKFKKFEKGDEIMVENLAKESIARLKELKKKIQEGEKVIYSDVLHIPARTREKFEKIKSKKKETQKVEIVSEKLKKEESVNKKTDVVDDTPKLLMIKQKVLRKVLRAVSFIVPKSRLKENSEIGQLDALFTLLHRKETSHKYMVKIDSRKEVNEFIMFFISSALDINRLNEEEDDFEIDFYLNEIIQPENLIASVKRYIKKSKERVKRRKKNKEMIGIKKQKDVVLAKVHLYPDNDELQLWNYVKTELEKYSTVLKKRKKLSLSNKKIRKQNKELKLLLANYRKEKFNQLYYKQHEGRNYNERNMFI